MENEVLIEHSLALNSEPGQLVRTGEPVAWKRQIRPQFPGYYNVPWKTWKELTGVRWACPQCGHEASVELRYRRGYRYWFQCSTRRCGWKRNYNHISAAKLCQSLGIAPAGRDPIPADLADS